LKFFVLSEFLLGFASLNPTYVAELESRLMCFIVIPANAGIQKNGLDAGFRRYDRRTFMRKMQSRFFKWPLKPCFRRGGAKDRFLDTLP